MALKRASQRRRDAVAGKTVRDDAVTWHTAARRTGVRGGKLESIDEREHAAAQGLARQRRPTNVIAQREMGVTRRVDRQDMEAGPAEVSNPSSV